VLEAALVLAARVVTGAAVGVAVAAGALGPTGTVYTVGTNGGSAAPGGEGSIVITASLDASLPELVRTRRYGEGIQLVVGCPGVIVPGAPIDNAIHDGGPI
jgi:hypothetical protein